MARLVSAERRWLALLLMASLLAASLIAAFPVGIAVADDACSGASSITDVGYYYIVEGTKGDDWIDCSSADKSVYVKASWGSDTVYGSAYGDWLLGGWGNDTLYGNAGDDYLYGGHGDDWLDGGDDTDTCLGGRGWDGLTACETADYGREP